MRRLFSLAMSDPSLAEAIAVLLGVFTVAVGFFFILTKQAYLAGVYAAPITPYGSIRGYVSGFNQPIALPSEGGIREVAAGSFLSNLLGVKLQVWLVSITSLFITTYPLASRLKGSIIPASGITSSPPSSMIWWSLIPVVLTSLGISLILFGMGAAAYKAYFGVNPTVEMFIVLSDLSLYIVAAAVLFYGLFIVMGRPEIGILFGFLGALGIDRVPLSSVELLVFDLTAILAGILLIILALNRRWLAI